jgi:hypothetical protein
MTDAAIGTKRSAQKAEVCPQRVGTISPLDRLIGHVMLVLSRSDVRRDLAKQAKAAMSVARATDKEAFFGRPPINLVA